MSLLIGVDNIENDCFARIEEQYSTISMILDYCWAFVFVFRSSLRRFLIRSDLCVYHRPSMNDRTTTVTAVLPTSAAVVEHPTGPTNESQTSVATNRSERSA